MNFQIIKANPSTESEQLSLMQVTVLPDEQPFPKTVWGEEKIETWWVIIDDEKVGIISIERDSAPGDTYESESRASPGSIYLILIGFVPAWQSRGLGKVTMEWLKTMVRSRDGNCIVSNLSPDNEASVALHTSAGFETIGSRPNYYSNPTRDSLVLALIFFE